MTEPSLADIVELYEAPNYHIANQFLERGYILLRLMDRAQAARKGDTKESYVRRWPCFVLGRPSEIQHFDPASANAAVPA